MFTDGETQLNGHAATCEHEPREQATMRGSDELEAPSHSGTDEFGEVTKSALRVLLKKKQYKCALTGRRLTPETASLDHIIPISRGGRHEIANVQWVHREVNEAKRSMTVDEFARLCSEVVAELR